MLWCFKLWPLACYKYLLMFSGPWNTLHIEWPNVCWILWHSRGWKAFLPWHRRLDVITLTLHEYRFSKVGVCLRTTTTTVFGCSVSEEKKSISYSSREYTMQEADLENCSDLFVFKVYWSNWSSIPFSYPLFCLSFSFKSFPYSYPIPVWPVMFLLLCSAITITQRLQELIWFFLGFGLLRLGFFHSALFYSQASKRDVRTAHLLTSHCLLRDGAWQ